MATTLARQPRGMLPMAWLPVMSAELHRSSDARRKEESPQAYRGDERIGRYRIRQEVKCFELWASDLGRSGLAFSSQQT